MSYKNMQKSRATKFLEDLAFKAGIIVLSGFVYIYGYAYNFDFSYSKGEVIGMCEQGTRKGVEIRYLIDGKPYNRCDKRHDDKGFERGDIVYLRVLNKFHSFAWIDLEKTKEQGVLPQKPSD